MSAQHVVVAGLHRDVQVGQTFGSVASASSSESLTWITSTLREADALHAGDPGHLEHQLAELEPPLGVAVVADADPGHHHLGLALGDAAAHLVQDRAGRTRAGARRGPWG